jgi:16S rRNA (guanine527-N7)-methyltransferase
MPDIIKDYFPRLSEEQLKQFSGLRQVYEDWNSKINVISRKDIDNFFIHHVLHSLAIARVFTFTPGSTVLDVGTGGGFPGIPLAIFFPDVRFTLLDSIEKKIKVVTAVAVETGLKNVTAVRKRAEEESGKYNFVVSRAVTGFEEFVKHTSKNILTGKSGTSSNGIICLKGGDLTGELMKYSKAVQVWNISDFFTEPFFETKKIVYLPASFF